MVRIAAPLRGAGHRFALGFLILAAFALMFLGKADNHFVERLRTTVTDVAMPVLEVVAAPIAAVNRAVDHVHALTALHAENARLREEVERLRGWHAAALRLEAENKSFRALLNYRGPDRNAFVSARVVADGRGPFVKSLLVNVGTRDGIAKGHAAVTQLGLVGRVTEVGERSARILMITDLNSRIPVLLEDTRTRAILAGDNTGRPQLAFLPDTTRLRPGQRVVTSGHGGGLPHGIPVGVVTGVEKGIPRVRPFADWGHLEYVEIIDYDVAGLPGAASSGRAAPSAIPPPGAGSAP